MININNKRWDKLRFSDIQKILSGTDDESFFFEFKADDVTPKKLIKEISAFANTYGGYIILGIKDDKSIGGCKQWTEQRIHTTIHDSITPTPIFDVKRFRPNGENVFVIRIEEGNMPPYVTGDGHIYERVSSGSFPIKDSAKLSQLYYKREDQLRRIKNKIELEEINTSDRFFHTNICGYLDLGFSLNLSEATRLDTEFTTFDFGPVADCIRKFNPYFSISRLGGHSYIFSIGNLTATNAKGEKQPLFAGISNFIEVQFDGSVKCRILLSMDPQTMRCDISSLEVYLDDYKTIYETLFGMELLSKFISAQKYEKLTVIKQFVPVYDAAARSSEPVGKFFKDYLPAHERKYGNNLMIESSRLPQNDYTLIDKRYVQQFGMGYSAKTIIESLFAIGHYNLGYIDPIQIPELQRIEQQENVISTSTC